MRGRILQVDPYDAYVKYLALKSHFSDPKYDFIKYNGKVKAWRTTFETRKDKYFFYKLSKKKDPVEFLIANFVDNDDFYIGDIREDRANQVYMDFKKRQQALSYTFKSDLSKLKEDFNSNIIVPENEHPYLLRLYMRKDICIETLTLIDRCVKMFSYWDKELDGDIMWPSIKLKAQKYSPFLNVDINKYREIILSTFNNT
tara:strand:+ start:4056 stop:4655 length:600 start_codon:yes stop_codon:yes gene_type:complete